MSHGWDNISIKMMQTCGDPIALPLMLVSETALRRKISGHMEKANAVPVHKKEKKIYLKTIFLLA